MVFPPFEDFSHQCNYKAKDVGRFFLNILEIVMLSYYGRLLRYETKSLVFVEKSKCQ